MMTEIANGSGSTDRRSPAWLMESHSDLYRSGEPSGIPRDLSPRGEAAHDV